MSDTRKDPGCTCVVGDAVEYHGHRAGCPAARRHDSSVSCDTCGKRTGIDTGICGQCAEDWNDRDTAAGTRRINRRRQFNGLAPLRREVVSDG